MIEPSSTQNWSVGETHTIKWLVDGKDQDGVAVDIFLGFHKERPQDNCIPPAPCAHAYPDYLIAAYVSTTSYTWSITDISQISSGDPQYVKVCLAGTDYCAASDYKVSIVSIAPAQMVTDSGPCVYKNTVNASASESGFQFTQNGTTPTSEVALRNWSVNPFVDEIQNYSDAAIYAVSNGIDPLTFYCRSNASGANNSDVNSASVAPDAAAEKVVFFRYDRQCFAGSHHERDAYICGNRYYILDVDNSISNLYGPFTI